MERTKGKSLVWTLIFAIGSFIMGPIIRRELELRSFRKNYKAGKTYACFYGNKRPRKY